MRLVHSKLGQRLLHLFKHVAWCCPAHTSGLPAPTVRLPCSNAYNMVVNKHGERLYRGLVETETSHLQKVGTAGLPYGCQGRADGAHHARWRCRWVAALCCRSPRGGSTLQAAMFPFTTFTLHTAMPSLQVAARIEAAQGEGFLRAIKSEWDSHNKSVHVGVGAEGLAWVLDWLAGLLAGALLCAGISQMLLELCPQPC